MMPPTVRREAPDRERKTGRGRISDSVVGIKQCPRCGKSLWGEIQRTQGVERCAVLRYDPIAIDVGRVRLTERGITIRFVVILK